MSDKLPTLDELRALEKAATPGPWDQKSEDEHRVTPREGPEDEALIVAMRNALPHLLAIAEAKHNTTTAHNAVCALAGSSDVDAVQRALNTEGACLLKEDASYAAARAAGMFGEAGG